MRRQAATLDPTCWHCVMPMTLIVAGCPLLARRFLAECAQCGRTVAVTLTARVLRAGNRGATAKPPPPSAYRTSWGSFRTQCQF